MQALFNSLGSEVKGKTIGLGGDGRYFNKDAAQIIIKLAAAAGVEKVGTQIQRKLHALAGANGTARGAGPSLCPSYLFRADFC